MSATTGSSSDRHPLRLSATNAMAVAQARTAGRMAEPPWFTGVGQHAEYAHSRTSTRPAAPVRQYVGRSLAAGFHTENEREAVDEVQLRVRMPLAHLVQPLPHLV